MWNIKFLAWSQEELHPSTISSVRSSIMDHFAYEEAVLIVWMTSRNFHLINPTTDDYRFSWTDRTLHRVDKMPNFHCTVPQGIAKRGKQTDLAFTFLAEEVGVFESFWLFSIERYNLECLFLVVGVVREPLVHCLTVHVKLKPTILGRSRALSVRTSSSFKKKVSAETFFSFISNYTSSIKYCRYARSNVSASGRCRLATRWRV